MPYKRNDPVTCSKSESYRTECGVFCAVKSGKMRGEKTTSQVCILAINFDSFLENEVELSHSGEQLDRTQWNKEQ